MQTYINPQTEYFISLSAKDVISWMQGTHDALSKLGQPFILDVRNHDELQKAKLNIAYHHIPMSNILQSLHNLPKSQAIVCMCHHGMRSASVANILIGQGFKDVYNLEGGIHAMANLDPTIGKY